MTHHTELSLKRYCTECHEIVHVGHTREEHRGEPAYAIEVFRIHRDGDDYVAQPGGMGHMTQHTWGDIDGHETCLMCGAVKLDAEDVLEAVDGG